MQLLDQLVFFGFHFLLATGKTIHHLPSGDDESCFQSFLLFLTRFLREEKCDDHYSQTLSNRRCSMIIITVSIVGTV